jgi:hypothetical protein
MAIAVGLALAATACQVYYDPVGDDDVFADDDDATADDDDATADDDDATIDDDDATTDDDDASQGPWLQVSADGEHACGLRT